MQTKTYTLELETDYTKNGNSTGTPIDTLGIAFGFGDSNEMSDNNIDYIADQVEYVKKEWLQSDAEQYFRQQLNNDLIEQYANDLPAYDEALNEYRDTFEGVTVCDYDNDNEAQCELQKVLEKAEGDMYDELYNTWLHGDYRERGLLDTATRYYSDYSIEISDGKQGNVEVTLSDETLQALIDDNTLDEDATIDDVIKWLQNSIDYKAYSVYQKEQAERTKRREERERVAKYQAEQKEKAQERKKAEILALKK